MIITFNFEKYKWLPDEALLGLLVDIAHEFVEYQAEADFVAVVEWLQWWYIGMGHVVIIGDEDGFLH